MNKKIVTFSLAMAIIGTTFITPVMAATNINPPTSYSSYTDYEDYVKGLLNDGLITQKGADALLEDYNKAGIEDYNGGRFGGCYGGGYGRCGGYGMRFGR